MKLFLDDRQLPKVYPQFLASQDALEVKLVWDWVSVSIDLTDVTLVSDDTFRRLYWCDPDDLTHQFLTD